MKAAILVLTLLCVVWLCGHANGQRVGTITTASGQQLPNPNVIVGPYGVPVMVKGDTGWQIPIKVFSNAKVEIFIPDITGPTWAAWHVKWTGSRDFIYCVQVYTYYRKSRSTSWGSLITVDTQHPKDLIVTNAFKGRWSVNLTGKPVLAKVVANITARVTEEAKREQRESAALRSYIRQERQMAASEAANVGRPPGVGSARATARCYACRDSSSTHNDNPKPSRKRNSGIQSPVLLYAPRPHFTSAAKREKLNGTVTVQCTIGTNGKPKDIRIVGAHLGGGLDQEAIKAVSRYEFKPAIDRATGKPVPFTMKIQINFKLF